MHRTVSEERVEIAGHKITLFPDGADLNEIGKFHEMGVIAGIHLESVLLEEIRSQRL
jgi:hypothetical protein